MTAAFKHQQEFDFANWPIGPRDAAAAASLAIHVDIVQRPVRSEEFHCVKAQTGGCSDELGERYRIVACLVAGRGVAVGPSLSRAFGRSVGVECPAPRARRVGQEAEDALPAFTGPCHVFFSADQSIISID
jgi:hypothetical protein